MTGKHLDLSAVCAENVVTMSFFCIVAVYRHAQHRDLCESLTHHHHHHHHHHQTLIEDLQ